MVHLFASVFPWSFVVYTNPSPDRAGDIGFSGLKNKMLKVQKKFCKFRLGGKVS